jgi:hypothetical protein
LWSAHDFLQIEDTRNPAGLRTFTFEGSLAFLYAALVDRPCTATKIKEELSLPWPAEEVEAALNEFCVRDPMIREDNLILAQALPATQER